MNLWHDYDLPDIPQHFLDEVAHFFSVYKDLEGVHVKKVGWERAEKARESIRHAVALYQQQTWRQRRRQTQQSGFPPQVGDRFQPLAR